MDTKSALFLLVALILFFIFASGYTANLMVEIVRESAVVERVVDGDTITLLANGDKVRLLGINTPERGQYLYAEAKERLEELILGSPVLMEADVTDTDKYGRLLRYIYSGGENINIRMVREGLAFVYIIEPDNMHAEELYAAECYAREQGLGIWQYTGIEDAFCIGLHYPFRYNAAGDDRQNLNGEFLILRNSCTYPVELSGWVLSNEAGNEYLFKEFVLINKSTVTLYTGSGVDTKNELYWGMDLPAWNNGGDTLHLWNAEDELMLKHSYQIPTL